MTRLRTLDEARADTPRCWWCGAEPTDWYDVTRLCDPEPVYIPGEWDRPSLDGHTHAITPPEPGELATQGDAAIERIRKDLAQ